MLNQFTVSQLQQFIHNCLGTRSPKTGKMIHINTFKWSKSRLIDLIERSGYALTCCQYLNGEEIW